MMRAQEHGSIDCTIALIALAPTLVSCAPHSTPAAEAPVNTDVTMPEEPEQFLRIESRERTQFLELLATRGLTGFHESKQDDGSSLFYFPNATYQEFGGLLMAMQQVMNNGKVGIILPDVPDDESK